MDDPYRGGFVCERCGHREFLEGWMRRHIEDEHPEWKAKKP